MLDELLVDEVGLRLLERCESMIAVTDAHAGRVHCLECDAIVLRPSGHATTELRCSCGWTTTWGKYHKSYQHKRLLGPGLLEFLNEYVRNWRIARTSRERFLAIDRLIHRWHWELRQDIPLAHSKPACANFIQGNLADVMTLLGELSGTESATWHERARSVDATTTSLNQLIRSLSATDP